MQQGSATQGRMLLSLRWVPLSLLVLTSSSSARRLGDGEGDAKDGRTWTAGVAIAPAVPAAATPRRRERRALRASRAAAAAAQAPQRRALPPSAASGAMLWLGPIVW